MFFLVPVYTSPRLSWTKSVKSVVVVDDCALTLVLC